MVAVTRKKEVSLFGNFYPIVGPVRQQSAAQWAEKRVDGDYSKDSETPMSSWIISDNRGGVGVKDMEEVKDADRCWWSTAEIGYKNHNLLPRLTTQFSTNPGGAHPDIVIEYANGLYVAFGTDLRKVNNATGAYGSSLGTLVAVPTDAFVHKDKLYFACGTDFNRYDGSTLTTGATLGSAQACRYLEEWDDKLFTLDNDGQLDYSIDEGVTWSTNADSKLPSGYFTSLFEYRAPGGARALHMGTKVGLYHLDFDNARWRLRIKLPFHNFGCAGSVVWRNEAAYVSSGLAVYQYVAETGGVTDVGPHLDAGLPSEYRGSITKLLAGHNYMYAFIDSTAEEIQDMYLAGDDEYGEMQFYPDVGTSLILRWDGKGWSTVYISSGTDQPGKGGTVAAADDIYRLWFGINRELYYQPLLVSLQNPVEVADFEYAASDEHITPWFDADNAVIDKLAAILSGYFTGMSATEYVKLYYGVDYDDDTWTLLTNTAFPDGQIDANGETEFSFASGEGLDFKAIRFKAEKARGSNTLLSPDMRWLRLSYIKSLPLRWGFQVTVDCSRNYRFKTARTLLDTLKAAKETGTLGEFTFKNGRGSETHWVKIMDPMQGAEVGARRSEGVYTLALMAP